MVIYWFRNDLRLHDNECIVRAYEKQEPVLCVYCDDPRNYDATNIGFKKTGILRKKFLYESLRSLRQKLIEKNNNLLYVEGRPEEIIPALAEEYGATSLIYQQEITSEELTVEQLLRDRLKEKAPDMQITAVWGLTLFHIDDLPFGPAETPLTSKSFRLKVSKNAEVRDCYPIPDQLASGDQIKDWGEIPMITEGAKINIPDINQFTGGEEEGLKRLNFYTFRTEQLTSYRWTRNRSKGMDYSSKFSPWMALGCLSPRMIYHEIKRYEEEVKKNASTWWLVFELVWRDYFKFLAMRFGDKIFFPGGYKDRETDWKKDIELFNRWKTGQTGIPFVDAHMREMNETGFMSNRGRVNCASFLTRDYKIDWRWGAAWFENRLIDYDVTSNWLNWNVQATEIWYTNPVHQGLKYDKKGDYVRQWIPEIRELPMAVVQAPWVKDEYDEIYADIVDYPSPVEIPSKWSRSIGNIKKTYENRR